MRVSLLGISHHTAPLEMRERLAIAGETVRRAVDQFQDAFPAAEVVVVSTCNRIEWYIAGPSQLRPSMDELRDFVADFCQVARAELTAASISREDQQAVEHLFRVVSGLESMVLGEPQILGQVKRAYEEAAALQSVGPALHKLFQQALAIGKQVRTQTGIDTGRVSVASAAVDFARQIFERFDNKVVLCIGAGEIAELTLRHLRTLGPKRLWLVNRSLENARALAEKLGLDQAEGGVRPFEDLDDLLVEADIVLTSTGSPKPILTTERIRPLLKRRRYEPLFLIDVAVPRDVEQQVGSFHNVYLYNVDDLQEVVQETQSLRRQQADEAAEIVEASGKACLAEIQSHDVDDLIRQLRSRLHELGRAELKRTLQKLRASPDSDVADLVERHTQRLINKILHLPLSQLDRRQPASRLGFAAAALRRLFGLEADTQAPVELADDDAADGASPAASQKTDQS